MSPLLDQPRVSVLVVSFNTRDLLLSAIGSVVDEPNVEVIVFDNASRDDSALAVATRYPSVQLLRSNVNLGFASGTNRAAANARGRAFLLLNPDAELRPAALDLLLEHLDSHPRAAAVGPALVYPDGFAQAAAFRFPGLLQLFLDLFPVPRLADSAVNGRLHHARHAVRIDHPLGACMLVRRAAWEDVGGFDEGYFMYLEEVDWCRRARCRGWQVWYQPAAAVMHHGASSTRQQADAMYAQLWRSRLRYYQRFHGPAYNRVVRALVRLGMRAAARRTTTASTSAVASVRELTG